MIQLREELVLSLGARGNCFHSQYSKQSVTNTLHTLLKSISGQTEYKFADENMKLSINTK